METRRIAEIAVNSHMSWNALALQSINPLSHSELFSYTGKTLKISGTSCTRGMKTESTCRWNWQNITWWIIVKGEDYLWVNVSGSKLSIAFEKNITWNDQWNFLLKLQGIEQEGFDINVVHFYLQMYLEKTDSSFIYLPYMLHHRQLSTKLRTVLTE